MALQLQRSARTIAPASSKLYAGGITSKRCIRARAEGEATPTSAVQDVKIESTISALDALLPAPKPTPAPAPKPVAAPSSTSASSSGAWGPASTSSAAAATAAPAPARKSAPASLDQVMGFEGFAPEIINGRCAMIGFMAAILSETGNGESLFAQVVSGGAGKAALVILAITVASFAPIVRQIPFEDMFGKNKTPANWGPFTPNAEMRNGRAAMLGLAVLIFLEGASNQAFFM